MDVTSFLKECNKPSREEFASLPTLRFVAQLIEKSNLWNKVGTNSNPVKAQIFQASFS